MHGFCRSIHRLNVSVPLHPTTFLWNIMDRKQLYRHALTCVPCSTIMICVVSKTWWLRTLQMLPFSRVRCILRGGLYHQILKIRPFYRRNSLLICHLQHRRHRATPHSHLQTTRHVLYLHRPVTRSRKGSGSVGTRCLRTRRERTILSSRGGLSTIFSTIAMTTTSIGRSAALIVSSNG